MKRKFLFFRIIVFLLLGYFYQQTYAQTYPSFPYIASFGTSSFPGVDNALYLFTSSEKENNPDHVPTTWSFSADNTGALYPTFVEESAMMESNGTVVTRPFYFRKNGSYRLKIAYKSESVFSGVKALIRLAPSEGNGDYYISFSEAQVDENNKNNVLINLNSSGFTQGLSSFEYDINVPVDSIYTITVAIYPTDGNFFLGNNIIRITNLEISERGGTNVSVGKVISPVSSCSLAEQTVSFWLQNNGSTAIKNVKAYYKIGKQEVVSQNFTVNIPGAGSEKLTFTKKVSPVDGIQKVSVYVDATEQDVDLSNDTSAVKYVSINTEAYLPPLDLDLLSANELLKWNVADQQKQAGKSWSFISENNIPRVELSTAKADNNDALISPCIKLDSGITYRFEFSYSGLQSGIDEKLGSYISENMLIDGEPQWDNALLIWKNEKINNGTYEKIVAFYTPEKDGDYNWIFRAYSDNFKSGIRLKELKISKIVLLNAELYYEFDPHSDGISSEEQLSNYVDFLNVNADKQSWSVNTAPDKSLSYNSYYHIKAEGEVNTVSDDWMIFRPFYLEQGVTYNLGYTRRAASLNKGVSVEVYIHKGMPPYDSDGDKALFIKDVVNNTNYKDTIKTFTPTTNGIYFFSFRYVTSIPGAFGTNANDYSLFLDNIRLYCEARQGIQPLFSPIPSQAQLGGENVYLRSISKNYSGTTINASDAKFGYKINDGIAVVEEANTDIKPYEIFYHDFATAADFSTDKEYVISFWTSVKGSVSQDTFKVTVQGLPSYETPYWEPFSDSSHYYWSEASSAGATSAWQILKNEEYNSPLYLAVSTAGNTKLDDYLITPAVNLVKNTKYLISFYAKRKTQGVGGLEPNKIDILYAVGGKDISDFIGNIAGSAVSLSDEYKKYNIYFNAQADGPAFFAFHSTLSALSGSVYIDDLLIMDSVSALKTNIRLKDIQYSQLNSCDENKTTDVSFKIYNDAFLSLDSVCIKYSLNGSPLKMYQAKQKIASQRYVSITLPEKWDLSGIGSHELVIFADMSEEDDRANDTLRAKYNIGSIPVLPLSYDFEDGLLPGSVKDANEDNNTWKIVNSKENAYHGSYFLKYENSGAEANDKITLSCFSAQAKEYSVDFYARGAKDGSEERLKILLVDYQSQSEPILIKEIIVKNTDYSLFQIPFKIEEAGNYAIMLSVNSRPDGMELCIDDIAIAEYGLKDIAIVQLVSPVQEDFYEETSGIQVKLKNNGRIREENIPIQAYFKGQMLESGEVSLNGGQESVYSFSSAIDMREIGRYQIEVRLLWDEDQNRSNDTVRADIIQEERVDIRPVELTMPAIRPSNVSTAYKKDEIVEIKVENLNKTTISNVPVTVYVNDIELKGNISEIKALSTVSYRFNKTVDMSDSVFYNFVIITNWSKDKDKSNDTLRKTIDGRYTPVSNENILSNLKIEVYPNPVLSTIFVSLPEIFSAAPVKISIYSQNGILAKEEKIFGGALIQIEVSDLPQGLYVLRVSSGGVFAQKKFIKE